MAADDFTWLTELDQDYTLEAVTADSEELLGCLISHEIDPQSRNMANEPEVCFNAMHRCVSCIKTYLLSSQVPAIVAPFISDSSEASADSLKSAEKRKRVSLLLPA